MKKDRLQLGLTQREIRRVLGQLRRLLKRIDQGEFELL
jgi:predicted transcriptional regulator